MNRAFDRHSQAVSKEIQTLSTYQHNKKSTSGGRDGEL